MIHIMVQYPDRVEQNEVDEDDFPPAATYMEMRESMVKKGATMIVVTLDDGFQILYTIKTD